MKKIINKGKKIMWIVLGIILLFVVAIRLYNIKEFKEVERISIFEKKFHSYLVEQFKNQVDTVIITNYTKKYEKEIIEYAKTQGYRLDSRKKIKIGLGTDYILIFRKNIKIKIRKDWV